MRRAKRTRQIAVLVWCGLLMLLMSMGVFVMTQDAWAQGVGPAV